MFRACCSLLWCIYYDCCPTLATVMQLPRLPCGWIRRKWVWSHVVVNVFIEFLFESCFFLFPRCSNFHSDIVRVLAYLSSYLQFKCVSVSVCMCVCVRVDGNWNLVQIVAAAVFIFMNICLFFNLLLFTFSLTLLLLFCCHIMHVLL